MGKKRAKKIVAACLEIPLEITYTVLELHKRRLCLTKEK